MDVNKVKSTVGVDKLHIALVTQDDTNGYTAEVPEQFAPAIEIGAEPSTSQETQYADNVPFDVLTGEGPTVITMSTTNISVEMLAKVLGKVFDATSGRMYDTGGEAIPPDVAFSFRSLKSNGKFRYYQYLKGKFSVPKDEAATATEKKEPKPAQIIYTAINTVYKFDVGGSENKTMKRVVGDEDSLNFSGAAFFNQVQTPDVQAISALALSSSIPADDATGVVVTANLTLTFNNPLKDEALNNITLLDGSGNAVACSKALNIGKTVVTIDPTPDLSPSTTYTVVMGGVMDLYGQTLTTTISFTTAA